MSDASYRDAIFSTPLDKVARFSFDERVVACFPDMIRRSVPGYGQILGMLGVIAERHLRHGAHVYDLGCSLGAVGLALAGQLPKDAFSLTGVDLSPAMVERARQTLEHECPDHAIEVIEGDIRHLDYRPSGMIVLNFTLQFLAPEDRDGVLEKLYQALEPGGVLILSEKIKAGDEQDNAWLVERYHDFKRANGYSDLEISQKRNALENVLVPDTLEQHHQRLARVGFARSLTWFQYLNFASMVAFK
ncbi:MULTISPECIES: carboxy-S-adenosyl-L-methionine synthase CmoA [unclassified Halomonas]|uniref:carboxy-S-adenosyl-L-methionine synthase CmoA n=1 Tax=unclassified Halomonas TaxID=2609666 RepID=UPI0005F9E18E|nr:MULTISPECIES: carboxy-S-adenosyl-L-methionine synthase CmoA [unclassified Halomonas]MBR9770744.1 carboxy-S-adenosyl-L-methionine synthase CmoA [Gammaproteobacteria bacterium]KJZ06625.1 tRNA (cmo5U34)-methyltransferase [Halomonas sp. S2151]MAR71685.1 carboxy-S-adenosyl-L-methionine synthase CmoA [Halomonas sp.]MBR9881398.1 carboxy-S-adenosyl-L-methionine synthase CmoA [Gammaproteobacteria bacterium]MCJ8283921.1 carboxy-S-adenosyl-L-methionine synthase CmoA [Halomonas sp.]|tara:strand:- start:952 stop:1689 length:738 start_codon:yes stop_codon:yes gene_type:complete